MIGKQEKTLTLAAPLKIKNMPYKSFDRSVCTAAICENGSKSAVATNEQILREKMTCAKFQIQGQTDGHG